MPLGSPRRGARPGVDGLALTIATRRREAQHAPTSTIHRNSQPNVPLGGDERMIGKAARQSAMVSYAFTGRERRLVADLTLDNQALKELIRKKA
jgi:hypothetical protein